MKRVWLALAGVLLVSACSSGATTSPATTTTSGGAATSGTGSGSTSQPTASSVSTTTTGGSAATGTAGASPTTSTSTSPTTVPSTTSPSTTRTAAAPATTSAPCPVQGGTAAVQVDGPLSRLIGTAVRTGAQRCFERVVIELKDSGSPSSAAFPGYHVAYVTKPVTADPSGLPVSLKGNAALVVTLQSWMSGQALGVTGYEGPKDLFPRNVTAIRELRLIGDFEGVSSWAIGLDKRRNFRVWTTSKPARLVIDIQTGP